MIGNLLKRLDTTAMTDVVNMIILSDHGMAAGTTPPNKQFQSGDCLACDFVLKGQSINFSKSNSKVMPMNNASIILFLLSPIIIEFDRLS